MNHHFRQPHTHVTCRGFTLIELMVTVAIVVLITGIALVRYGTFNNTVLLRSQAYEIALDIRTAQTYGVSVSGQGEGNYLGSYGLHFDTASDGLYVLFQDQDGDLFYDSGEEVGSLYVIDPRFRVARIETNCGDRDSVSITFKRPNFDAHFVASPACAVVDVGIVLQTVSANPQERIVRIAQTGYVMIE